MGSGLALGWQGGDGSGVIESLFAELLAGEELGMSFVAEHNGVEKVALHGGFKDRHRSVAWTADTMLPIWSASKGPMATGVMLALLGAGMDGSTEVARVWPELLAAKNGLVFNELLSHQGGLAGVDDTTVSLWDYEAVIAALEKTIPRWSPPEHGYHPRTLGFLADEIVRRLTGLTFGEFFAQEVATPNSLAVWFGLPEDQEERMGELVPRKTVGAGEPRAFYSALAKRESDTYWAFSTPHGVRGVGEMNESEAWRAGWPAMGGVAIAQGLARFYSWLMQQPYFEEMAAVQVSGLDRVQQVTSAFGFGLKIDADGWLGHPGAGGTYALCHPESGWSCAFVANSFERCLVPSPERRSLAAALL